MTLEVDLMTTLKSLVGNRMSPNTFPQPPAVPVWPAIRYTFVSTTPVVDLCGDGDDSTAEPRVQLDLVANGYKEVRLLRLQVMAAMRLFVPPAILDGSFSDYDPITKTHWETLDYLFYGSSDSGNSPP